MTSRKRVFIHGGGQHPCGLPGEQQGRARADPGGHRVPPRPLSLPEHGGGRAADINLHIRPGERIALVGLNGAGKTTWIKLLTRLYDPTAGQILLDGVDLREYDLATLHQRFGVIFQDFALSLYGPREHRLWPGGRAG